VEDDVKSMLGESQGEGFSQSVCRAGDESEWGHERIVIGK
jgi:hypothetical protein